MSHSEHWFLLTGCATDCGRGGCCISRAARGMAGIRNAGAWAAHTRRENWYIDECIPCMQHLLYPLIVVAMHLMSKDGFIEAADAATAVDAWETFCSIEIIPLYGGAHRKTTTSLLIMWKFHYGEWTDARCASQKDIGCSLTSRSAHTWCCGKLASCAETLKDIFVLLIKLIPTY